MKQDLRLGRVAGIPIGAQWSALVIGALIMFTLATGILPSALPHRSPALYWAAALPGAAVFLVCLLAHELAHSLVAQHYDVKVRSITLWMLGGVSEMESDAPDARADLAIAAAGPLTSLALGGVFTVAAVIAAIPGASPLVVSVLLWLAVINVILGVFNLLPGAPLDGGRVLRAILWRRYHDRSRAELTAAGAGRALGIGLIVLGLAETMFLGMTGGLWMMLIGWFLMTAAKNEATARIVRDALKDRTIGEVMAPDPETGGAWQEIEAFLTHVVLLSRQSVFPVLDFDGTPVGVVTTEMLSRVELPERAVRRLREVMVPVPERNRCGPEDSAAELMLRPPVAGRLIALVLDGGRVVGIVTTDDLQNIIRRGLLRSGDR